MEELEESESGARIFRYSETQENKFEPAVGDSENIEAISEHIEKHVGPIEMVFHEIVSDQVHIDVHWVKPSDSIPFHVLITSGMSDKPMNVPEGIDAPKHLELCLLLPPDWKMEGMKEESMEEIFSDENVYWPVRWLKTMARFPHSYNTWLGVQHTLPNGENAEPFADSTKLGCMMLLPSISLGEDFFELKIENTAINFLCLIPLYREEMEYKLKHGTEKLLDKFDASGIGDVVDPERKNVCAKKGLFGLW
ncbi:suppressor of fused domain protein [Chryseolinea sp. T2]|uniref:suppressor of fused domain protein n=1 Tax=Chryseolinea sp. T2 TaxID=3129255 RepID=UPI0030780D34